MYTVFTSGIGVHVTNIASHTQTVLCSLTCTQFSSLTEHCTHKSCCCPPTRTQLQPVHSPRHNNSIAHTNRDLFSLNLYTVQVITIASHSQTVILFSLNLYTVHVINIASHTQTVILFSLNLYTVHVITTASHTQTVFLLPRHQHAQQPWPSESPTHSVAAPPNFTPKKQ